MKRQILQYSAWLNVSLLTLIVVGCMTMPIDTLNKRFAAFEVSYKAALVQIDTMERANSFKPETKPKVAALLKDVNKAREAAYIAKGSGDVLNAQDRISLAIALLDKLKTVLPAGGQI